MESSRLGPGSNLRPFNNREEQPSTPMGKTHVPVGGRPSEGQPARQGVQGHPSRPTEQIHATVGGRCDVPGPQARHIPGTNQRDDVPQVTARTARFGGGFFRGWFSSRAPVGNRTGDPTFVTRPVSRAPLRIGSIAALIVTIALIVLLVIVL